MTSIYGGRTSRPDLAVLADVRQRNAALVQRAVMPSDDDAHDRLIGCVLGLAVGDVLGCPVEGLRFRDIQRRYGSVGGLLIPEYGRHWRLPGLHSDDTQQALAVLIALERDGRPRSGAGAAAPDRQIAERLASLYVRGMQADVRAAFGCWRGTGRNFRSAVSRMSKDGHAPGAQGLVGSITQRLGFNQRATTWPFGYGEPSAGLGAVMRIPPLGVAATGDSFEALARLVAAVTLITHTHPLAVVSAAAAAFASRLLVDCQHDTFSPDQFLADLSARVRSLEEHLPSVLGEGEYAVQSEQQTTLVSTLITAVAGLVRIEPATVMRDLAERSAAATGRRTHPTEGFAPVGVAACLYFFAHDAGDPAAALLAAINAGGDTDTIGAIVGAFSGALYGPAAFRQFLPDLVALESIIRTANGERVDLIAEETRLTRLEEEIKARLAETVARRMNGGSAMNQQPRNSGWV
ncbi:MAG: ADP-ribosylglycohydrolase family protein, partial [Dehalococcoidia bacterium]